VLPEIVIAFDAGYLGAAALHRLKNKQVARDMLVDEIESKKGMSQMVEHPHEQDDIEALLEHADVINGETAEIDVEILESGGETRLAKILVFGIDRDDAIGAPPF